MPTKPKKKQPSRRTKSVAQNVECMDAFERILMDDFRQAKQAEKRGVKVPLLDYLRANRAGKTPRK